MPRTTGGVYTRPTGTTAVSGQPISSSDYNSVIDDLTAEQNSIRPVTAGGTGATSFATGSVLVGSGSSPIGATKTAPNGDFVGTTDTQTLTNKTLASPVISTGLTLPDNSVALADLVQVAASSVLGNMGGTTGNVGTVSVLDEDNMASNSASALATQQSIRAFVESFPYINGSVTSSSTSGETGHIKLQNLVLINWGGRNGSGPVTFSQPYTTIVWYANVSALGNTTRSTAYDDINLTGMTAYVSGGSTLKYVAIGI